MWQGSLLDIHTAAAGGEPMTAHSSATLIPGKGIKGDRYALGTGTYSRFHDIHDLTLIEIETIDALERDYGIVLPTVEHRRNLTTRDVPLNHLVGKQFWVGDVLLEGGRLNTPCRYLDKITGQNVCDIIVNRSGLNCTILQGGEIGTGDVIRLHSAE